jgi:hypothetical protein
MFALPMAIAMLAAPAPVSAYGGRVVWSRPRSARSFVLMTRLRGVTARVPVPPRHVPFDVDLGPGGRGGVAAVYTRCRRDPAGPSGYGAPVAYELGAGCDVYRFDFSTGRERRIAEASSPTANEAWPTLWRGRIAFERAYDGHRHRPYLYVHALGSKHASRRLPAGPRRACGRGTCGVLGRAHATGLDLHGRTLAFGWTYGGFEEGLATQLRLDGLGGSTRVVDRERGGGLTQVVVGWPSIEGGWVYWSRACFGDEAGCPGRHSLRRRRVGGGRIQNAQAPPFAVAHARGGGRTFVERASSGSGMCGEPGTEEPPCPLLELDPIYR